MKNKVVYMVPWIEVEFGQRDEGCKLFLNKEECISVTKQDSAKGCYEGGGGYLGPKRPLYYYEIPYSELEDWMKRKFRNFSILFVGNDFKPKFKSNIFYI